MRGQIRVVDSQPFNQGHGNIYVTSLNHLAAYIIMHRNEGTQKCFVLSEICHIFEMEIREQQ